MISRTNLCRLRPWRHADDSKHFAWVPFGHRVLLFCKSLGCADVQGAWGLDLVCPYPPIDDEWKWTVRGALLDRWSTSLFQCLVCDGGEGKRPFLDRKEDSCIPLGLMSSTPYLSNDSLLGSAKTEGTGMIQRDLIVGLHIAVTELL